MPDPNRLNVWSEQHNDASDSVHSLGEEHEDDVEDKTVKAGQLVKLNCQQCGRQVKHILPWSETVMYYVGQPVPGTRAQRDGITISLGCACGRVTPLKIEWDEVRKWIDNGIRIGALRKEVKNAGAHR